MVPAWFRLRYSLSTKKKVRFLPLYTLGTVTGPPSVNPKSFCRKGAFRAPTAFCAHELALNMSLYMYSDALPWHVLVPDLVTSGTNPPELRPISAEAPEYTTLNSAT